MAYGDARRMSEGEQFRLELENEEIDRLKPYALRSEERRKQLGERFREHASSSSLDINIIHPNLL